MIEALVDLGEDAVLDAMDEGLAARIIAEEPGAPGSFSFTHTLIRETVLQPDHGRPPRAASPPHRQRARAPVVTNRTAAR